MASELIAYCGLYCGACSFKTAFAEQEREHLRQMPARYDKLKEMELEDCPGCRGDSQCGDCFMRDCARAKKLDHCGQCEVFPCDQLMKFQQDGVPHHGEVIANLRQLRDMGDESWLAMQRKKWTCECGSRFSWYVRRCLHCGTARSDS